VEVWRIKVFTSVLQAPNFAFPLVARKYKESISSSSSTSSNQPKIDLSSMRHMINAAEPVDYQALRDFYATFGPLGLQRGVVFPTYGLAEHTVFVCSGGTQILTVTKASLEFGDSIRIVAEESISSLLLSEAAAAEETPAVDAELSLKIVGCGYPGRNQDVDVRIVHGVSNQPLGEDSVGEVWIDSPSKALGYWQQHELTAHDFHAKYTPAFGAQKADGTTDADDGRTYLRTGDLGFMHKNELFICGRLKDLIIVRGANHYPQDIERTAEQSHSAFRAGCSAAFAFSQGGHTEAVVYVAEVCSVDLIFFVCYLDLFYI
jgi:acyl-CoA synthetase (AMP-forming)/AMP-acid ligase II